MAEKIIEIKELEKKITGFIDVPKGDETTAYVFFQSKDNKKYIISTEKRKIMTAELRMGKYDRIMIIHLGEYTMNIEKEFACQEAGHSFYVEINIRYLITDPEQIYRDRIYQPTDEIEKCLIGIEFQLENDYSFLDRPGFKEEMSLLLKEKLDSLSYLKYSFNLKVEVDDSAKEIIKRMQQHEIDTNDMDLSAIEAKTKLENDYELEQARLDNEKKVAEQQAQLETLKVDHLGELIRKYGSNVGNLIDHSNGEMTGAQLSEVMNKTARDNRADLVNTIIKLKGEGILSKDAATQSSAAALGMGNTNMLEMSPLQDEEIPPEHEKFKWNDADVEDGDI